MRKLLAFCLFVLVTPSLFAANDAELFAAGREALRQNDAEKAAELLEKAVAAKPNNAEYHYWLGSAYGSLAQKASLFSQAGLAKKTKSEFERAVQLDPNLLEARFGLIDYYLLAPGFMGGDETKAIEQANEVKKRDALAGHRAWARIYTRQKKADLARKEIVDAVREQPSSAKAHYYLALTWMGDKNYPAAQHELEMAAQLDASYMPTYFRLGQLAALSNSNHAKGEEALKKYLGYKPEGEEPPLARAWYWLGGIYEKSGRKNEARSAYQKSLALAPGAKDVTEALKRVS